MNEEQDRQQPAFPNKISRIILLALRDIVGDNGMNAVLTTARLSHLMDHAPTADFEPGLSFAEAGRLFEAIEGIYGIRGGRRLVRQAGRESFKYWIEGFGSVVGIADVALRLLPLSLRAKIGMEVLAEILNRYSGQRVTLGEGSDSFFFVMETCGFCFRRQTEAPSCSFVVGVLEEILFWVTRGRHFIVEETTCIACGDPVCTICVDKVPLDQTA
ncbi:MAG: 4-vinyl reductase [Anaerolineae bacterium]